MANAVCPKCGAEAIDKSKACPQCGYVMDDPARQETPDNREIVWVGLGFVVLLIAWAVLFEPLMTRFNPFK